MRIVMAAAIIALLTGSAYCQTVNMSNGKPAIGFPLQDSKPNAPADPQSEEHENAYKSAIEKIPQKPKSADPWQGVRSGSGTQNKTTR
jgi:hypothetical protein